MPVTAAALLVLARNGQMTVDAPLSQHHDRIDQLVMSLDRIQTPATVDPAQLARLPRQIGRFALHLIEVHTDRNDIDDRGQVARQTLLHDIIQQFRHDDAKSRVAPFAALVRPVKFQRRPQQ